MVVVFMPCANPSCRAILLVHLAKHSTLDHNDLQLTASRQELSELGSSGSASASRAPRQLATKPMGSTCQATARFRWCCHMTLTSLLTQWPRQYFHTTCVKSGRSLATLQCRWGMDARAIRSKTLCVFRGRFHPYR